MDMARIDGATRCLGAPQGWDDSKGVACEALFVADVESPAGAVMVSEWRPTAEEIERIVAGEPVWLWVFGRAHPPVSLTVRGGTEA